MTIIAHNLYLIYGAIALFFVLVVLAFAQDSSDMDKRIERVAGQKRRIDKERSYGQNSVRSTKYSAIPFLDRLVNLLPNPNKLRIRLAATGTNIALGEYLLMNALSVLLFHLAFTMFGTNKIIVLPASLMLGLGLPHAVSSFMIARRIKKFLANFPEAIDTMCRGIRSGLPVTESMSAIGREMPDPIGIEFRRINDSIRMGKSMEEAMWDVVRRIDAPEFRFLIVAMAIQKETGGNLSETLSNLADLIRKRRQLRLKVKAMSSEAKASALIIGSLPFIMFGLLMIINHEYIQVMFDEPQGRKMIGCGIGWMAIGWGAMVKMTHFEI